MTVLQIVALSSIAVPTVVILWAAVALLAFEVYQYIKGR